MKTYLVTIMDVLEVEAENENEAQEIVDGRLGPAASIQEIEEMD